MRSAHDLTATTAEVKKKEAYQEEVGEERMIVGYDKVQIEPRWTTVPAHNYVNVPQYEDVVTKRFVGNEKMRIPPYTKSVEVFNYGQVPIY